MLKNAAAVSVRRYRQTDSTTTVTGEYFFMGVAKFTRSEERGCGFGLRKFQQARTARFCTLALLLNDLDIDSSLLPSPIPSLK